MTMTKIPDKIFISRPDFECLDEDGNGYFGLSQECGDIEYIRADTLPDMPDDKNLNECGFNNLRDTEKWNQWKDQSGKWRCPNCKILISEGPIRSSPFSGSSVCCGYCDCELTRRTGGGMNDPFRWVLVQDESKSIDKGYHDPNHCDHVFEPLTNYGFIVRCTKCKKVSTRDRVKQ
jgi:hypothetical protein